MNRALPRRQQTSVRTVNIIIAVDQADARAYADRHGHWPYIAVTPRSPYGARGRIAPVYATRKARTHARYTSLLADAAPAGATIPRTSRDRRVA